MANTPVVNGQLQPTLSLTPLQSCALLVIEQSLNTLAFSINQLAGLGLQAEANALKVTFEQLQRDRARFVSDWQRSVVVAPAAALSIIDGKTH